MDRVDEIRLFTQAEVDALRKMFAPHFVKLYETPRFVPIGRRVSGSYSAVRALHMVMADEKQADESATNDRRKRRWGLGLAGAMCLGAGLDRKV